MVLSVWEPCQSHHYNYGVLGHICKQSILVHSDGRIYIGLHTVQCFFSMLFLKSLIIDKFLSVWWAVVIVLLALPFAAWLFTLASAPAQDNCRIFTGHEVCITSIRRSAKSYWEYRTVVSVDGVKQPLELYNCRDRTRILASDGSIIPFLTGKTGDWVCQLTTPQRSQQIRERGEITIR